MSFTVEMKQISASYTLFGSTCQISVTESDTDLHLSTERVHILFNKEEATADVEIDFNLGVEKGAEALDALLKMRETLFEWSKNHTPILPNYQFSVRDIIQAIWVDLERTISSSVAAHSDFMHMEEDRIKASKWLRKLPHGTPLLLIGTPDFFDEENQAEPQAIAHIFVLDLNRGAATLFWPDGRHWRDFRPDSEDNHAVLATSAAIKAIPEDVKSPCIESSLCQRADVIKAMHGSRPSLPAPNQPIIVNLPTLNEWTSGVKQRPR